MMNEVRATGTTESGVRDNHTAIAALDGRKDREVGVGRSG
jgi:hypothetical protein